MHKVEHKFSYKWYLKGGYPSKGIEKHNTKVFSCFASGGGSTMGYKLAGFDVIGANEFVEEYAKCYKINHGPQYLFVEDIRKFKNKEDLPKELFNLDILDGSPPCSAFSLAGKREEGWGVEKNYANNRKKQVVDDLYFEFIDFAKRLQPKIIVAENVKGLISGNAKIYCKKIKEAFVEAGYELQLFLLNAGTMGVPQKRERVFFIARKRDLELPKLKLYFNERPILFKEVSDEIDINCNLNERYLKYWNQAKEGESVGKFCQRQKIKNNSVCNTITATGDHYHPKYPRTLNNKELCQIGSYPVDYNFQNLKASELIGRAVPPVMMAQLSHQIYLQCFKKIKIV